MDKPKKNRGRPQKLPEDKRTEVLYLKLTPAEKQLILIAFPEPTVIARELVLRAAMSKCRKSSRSRK